MEKEDFNFDVSDLNNKRVLPEDEKDEEDWIDKQMKEDKKRKMRAFKNGTTIAVIVLATVIAVVSLFSILTLNNKYKTLENEYVKSVENVQVVKNENAQIKAELEAANKELEELRSIHQAIEEISKPSTENTKEQEKGNTGSQTSISTGKNTYKVLSKNGLNVREEASPSAEIISSVDNNDLIETNGVIIRNNDGSEWIKATYENGYICITLADGTTLAEAVK